MALVLYRTPAMNVVALWLELIGTQERARMLQAEYSRPTPWQGCPSVVLFGQEGSYAVYAQPRYRAALDAWDTGHVTRRDVLCWAAHVASGQYVGPALEGYDRPAVA